MVLDRANVHGHPYLVIPDLNRFVDGFRLLLQPFEHVVAVRCVAAAARTVEALRLGVPQKRADTWPRRRL